MTAPWPRPAASVRWHEYVGAPLTVRLYSGEVLSSTVVGRLAFADYGPFGVVLVFEHNPEPVRLVPRAQVTVEVTP